MLGRHKHHNHGAGKKEHGPVVQSVRFHEAAHGKLSLDFVLDAPALDEDAPVVSKHEEGIATAFTLQPPHEYIVCVRFNAIPSGSEATLTGIQVQTNLGRRSKFHGYVAAVESGKVGTRYELYAPAGMAVTGFKPQENLPNNPAEGESVTDGSRFFALQTVPAPHASKKKLRRLLLLPSVRSLLLKTGGNSHPPLTAQSSASLASTHSSSVAMKMVHGGRKAVALQAVRHGLASKMFAAGEDGDALVRLILDGEQNVKKRTSTSTMGRRLSSLFSVPETPTTSSHAEDVPEEDDAIAFPPSILRAICDKTDSFDHSLMDLLSAGRERDGRPPLMRLLFESGIAKIIFRRTKAQPRCLAELMMTPDRTRGLRSLMQLMTDDEANDDPARPSVLRSLLAGEEQADRPSLLRIMFLKTPGKTITSLMDELIKGEDPDGDCIARRLLTESAERPVSLGRLFFSDTPGGKPALAKYVFGGETSLPSPRPSLMRLMVQGEARQQNSLLRLLVGFPGASNKSLMDLMTSGQPSLMDILLKGEESSSEQSLARLMLGTTFTLQNGRVTMGSMLGTADKTVSLGMVSSLLSSSSVNNKQAEQDGEAAKEQLRRRLQRGMTVAKACMLGEEDGGPGLSMMRVLLLGEEQGVSVLRLLTTGEEIGEVSPLRIIFTGMHAAFVVAHAAADSTKDSQGLLELAKNPSRWGEALKGITRAVVDSVNESHQANGSWKDSFDRLVEMGKRQIQSRDTWQENLAFLYTAFARVRSMGPEFAKTWKKQWRIVAKEIRLTGDRVKPESSWKDLAPHFATLVESIAEQQWQKVFVNVAHVVQAVEKAQGGTGESSPGMEMMLNMIEGVSNWAPKWF